MRVATPSTGSLKPLLLVILGAVIPILIVTSGNSFPWVSVGLFGLLTGYFAFRLTEATFLDPSHIMTFFFWLFMYVMAGLSGLASATQGRFGWNIVLADGIYTTDDLVQAAALIGLVTIAFEVGLRTRPRKPTTGSDRPSEYQWVVSYRKSTAIAFGSLVLTGVVLTTTGGLGFVFGTRYDRNVLAQGTYDQTTNVVATNLISALVLVPVFVCGYALFRAGRLHLLDTKSRALARKLLHVSYILLFIAFVLGNPYSAPRYWVGASFGSIALLVRRERWRKYLVRELIVGLGLLLIVFPYADLFRVSGSPELAFVSVPEALTTSDYPIVANTMDGFDVVERRGFDLGRQSLGTLGFWFPRAMWPSKPISSAELIATFSKAAPYSTTNNWATPLWMEGYLDFGLVGAIGFLYLYGLGVSYLDRRHFLDRGWIAGLVPFIALYQLFLLRGSLLGTIAKLIVAIVVYRACLTKKRYPPHAPATNPDRAQ